MKYFQKNSGGEIYGYDSDQQSLIDAAIANGYTELSSIPVVTPEPINHTTASKLKILDYFDGEGLGSSFLAILQSDAMRYERWLAAQDINISDPMVPVVRDAMGWTQQQLQDLFNALNS